MADEMDLRNRPTDAEYRDAFPAGRNIVESGTDPVPHGPGAHLRDLADQYAFQRTVVEAMKDELKPEDAKLVAITATLFDAMEAAGLHSVRTAKGLFTLSDLADAKVIDATTFVEWAKQEMPEILHPNFQRLSKLVRDSLKGESSFPGIEGLPPGVDFATRRGITWRRS